MAKKTQAVAKATAHEQLPATTDEIDFSGEAGRGLEHVGAGDLIIPRLVILQALSPQLDPNSPAHVEGAQLGDICDVALGKVYKKGVWVLPCMFRKTYIEWAPRKSGEGLKAIHTDPSILDECEVDDKRNYTLPNGNYIQETMEFYTLILNDERRKAYIPMARTQLKHGRKWITAAKAIRRTDAKGRPFEPPFYATSFKLTTAKESNNEGSWAGWKIETGFPIEQAAAHLKISASELRLEAMAFADMIDKGHAVADVGTDDEPMPEREAPRQSGGRGQRRTYGDQDAM